MNSQISRLEVRDARIARPLEALVQFGAGSNLFSSGRSASRVMGSPADAMFLLPKALADKRGHGVRSPIDHVGELMRVLPS
jgi:hypothetical protein